MALTSLVRTLVAFIAVTLLFSGLAPLVEAQGRPEPVFYTPDPNVLAKLWFSFDWSSRLDVDVLNKTVIKVGALPLALYKITYRLHPDHDTQVYGVILQRPDLAEPAPGVLLIHGIGGSHEQVLDLAKQLAARGYIVLAIDAPGHGASGIIGSADWREAVLKLDPVEENLLYQVYLAGIRGVEVLLQWNYTDIANIAVVGVSMGGMAAITIGCLHPNVKAAVPLIASGCITCMIRSGGIANIMGPETLTLDSPEARNLAYIDPLTYAQQCSGNKYFYFIFSTHDPYFPMEGLKLTVEALRARGIHVYTLVEPNLGHTVNIDDVRILVPVFLDEIAFPSKKLRTENYAVPYYIPFALGYSLADRIDWRPAAPGIAYLSTQVNIVVYPSPIEAFATYRIGVLRLSTLPEQYGGIVESVVSIAAGLLLLILLIAHNGLVPLLPYVGLIVASLATVMIPYYAVWPGRFSLSLLDFMETYSSLTGLVILVSALLVLPHALVLNVGFTVRRRWVIASAVVYAVLALTPYIIARLIVATLNTRAAMELGTGYAAVLYPLEALVAAIAVAAVVYRLRIEPRIRQRLGKAPVEEWPTTLV